MQRSIPSGCRSDKKPMGSKLGCSPGKSPIWRRSKSSSTDEITAYLDAIPNCLTTISGIGRILAAAILGEIGDIRRFKNAKALVAYAGVDPSVMQSGEFTAKKAHLSKRGSTHLRRAIWLAAAAATRMIPP